MRSAVSIPLLLILLLITASACTVRSRGVLDAERTAFQFENASAAAVRVYLIGAGQDWLLGRVEPAREVILRIPDGYPVMTAGSVTLVVLPVGATDRFGTGAGTVPQGIHSGQYRLNDLLGMKWVLAGERLVAHPIGPNVW